MKKILAILVIVTFFTSQLYLVYANKNLKHEIALKNAILDEQATKYSALQPQFPLSVQNGGRKIGNEIGIIDTAKCVHSLENIFKGNTLICRISDRYCKQCVDHTVSVLLDNKDSFDFSRIVFLSDTDSPRVFNLQIREYGLESCNIFRCGDLSLPIEKVMFPFFMVVDSSLTVIAVYAPSKSTHGTDFDYKNVKLMYDSLVADE